MWLADAPNSPVNDSRRQKDDDERYRSTSPPLEGGESLCELYGEQSVPKKEDAKEQTSENRPQAQPCTSGFNNSLPNQNLFSLLSHELLPTNTFTQTFLQSILSSVDSHDPVVANAWMETLLDVIDLLPKDIVKNEILTLAVNKGQISQPVSSRLLSCRMLGKLCSKFDSYVIKKEVLPVVLSLSQDVDHEVRGSMCRLLDEVAKGIGLEATKSAILPELVELANDEESFVRLASIETVVQMLPLLDDETCTLTIIPLVQKFCENSYRSEDYTLPAVAKQLGCLCHELTTNLTIEQKLWFLHYFQDLAKLGLMPRKRNSQGLYSPMPDLVPKLENKDRLTECRWACAYNFPAMVLFAGRNYFRSELQETFSNLCRDPFLNVKRTMAASFCEIVKFLDIYSPMLMPELTSLLSDDSLEVLKGIIPHLPEILKTIFKSQKDSDEIKESIINDLVQAMISCEVTTSISSNWRLHAEMLTQFSSLGTCLPADVIYDRFVPLLLIKLYSTRPIPCRTACAYSLLVLLRHTPKLEQRNGIIDKLIRDLCYSKSCHKRMLFFTVCDLVLGLFSKNFFKKHFFNHALVLCDDYVPNIRLRLCAMLPKMKCIIKLPKDSILLQSLESCVRKLMTDEKDRDVTEAVAKAIEELDKIEVPTEQATKRLSMDIESNFEDMRKEEEENRLIQMEFGLGSFSVPTTPSRNVNRPGKIPVRKSGTLPKASKTKKFESATLTKASTQAIINNKLNKGLKEEAFSSLKFPVKFRSNKKDIIRSKTMSSLSQRNSALPTVFTDRPDTPSVDYLLDESLKCQSPVDNATLVKMSKLSTQEYPQSLTPVRRRADVNKAADSKARRSITEIFKSRTPVPSPEVSRRLPVTPSKIPTPSSRASTS